MWTLLIFYSYPLIFTLHAPLDLLVEFYTTFRIYKTTDETIIVLRIIKKGDRALFTISTFLKFCKNIT